ncbi:MAG: ArsC family reductase [Nitrosomonadales bacterium]|nr:ArsC family reductase [Nitrosomonadales bacterium]
MKLYGIPNCSTVKKARDWLAQHNIAVEFHDFRKHGVDSAAASLWLQQKGWTVLVNRSGLTWRGLSEQSKQQVCNDAAALALMLEKPSVIKRPLLEQNGKLLHVGFDESAYSRIFNL